MIKSFKRQGKIYTLIHKDNIKSCIDFISRTQTKTGIFLNVSIKPYKGKAWNPEKVCYIVQG